MRKKELRKIILVSSLTTLFLSLFLVGGGYLLYTRYVPGWVTQWKTQHQFNSILKQVSKVVRLPDDEKPEISSVLDAEELKKNDTFFSLAQDGNAVLLYKKSGLIVLFDVTNNQLLNMGTVTKVESLQQ